MAFKRFILSFLAGIFLKGCIAFNQTCIDTPFLERCLQRNVFRRNYRYVTMTNDLCAIGNQDGLIVLVNVYTGELNSTVTADKLAELKVKAGENEENNTCLFDHLRPKLSGFTRAANVIVPYQKCSVDNTKGYIVIEYSCVIDTTSILEIPKCSGVVNGSRIRIQNAGFPNTGLNTSGDHCRCTIWSEASILNITTYYLRLSNQQAVTIADAHGVGVTYTDISMDGDRNTELLRVNGDLNLTWTNNETIPNDIYKFWLEMNANGTLISITCEVLSLPTTTAIGSTPARTKALPDVVGSTKQTFDSSNNINSTVETTKVPQQGSLPTKYPGQTQLHNRTTTQQRQTKTPDERSISTGESTFNIYADTTAKGGDSETSKVAEDGETGLPFIRVVVIVITSLLLVALLITGIVVYKKKQKAKLKGATQIVLNLQQNKRKSNDIDDDKEKADGAGNTPSCKDHTDPDDAKTRPKPILPLLGAPNKVQPIGNTSFDLHRLPPNNTDTQKQSDLHIAVLSDGLVREGPEDIVEKKKKRKKKRRKKTTIHPDPDELHNEDFAIHEIIHRET